MDRHFIDAFIESLIDHVTARVALRLGLRPPVKALERPLAPTPEPFRAVPDATPPALPAPPLPEYLSPRQAAEVLGVSEEGLQKMRSEGRGPKYVKVGGRIRYRRSELP
jgi:hypothetical protein